MTKSFNMKSGYYFFSSQPYFESLYIVDTREGQMEQESNSTLVLNLIPTTVPSTLPRMVTYRPKTQTTIFYGGKPGRTFPLNSLERDLSFVRICLGVNW